MEDPNRKFQEGQSTASGFGVDNVLNREGDILPFGYFSPESEGKLTWICGEGIPRKKGEKPDIISTFQMDYGTRKEKEVKILENLDQAIYFRDELIKNGWQKLIPPKIEFTMEGSNKPLNRKQKRYLEKKVKNFAPKD